MLAGRGFGKTRTGAEWVRNEIQDKKKGRLALIARSAADARDVMIEGESGILAISPPWFRPTYEPSKRRLTWPNGAICTAFSSQEPDLLRGPQHDGLWADELAAWRYPETWDMALFGLRLGKNPQAIITTTPKPTPLLKGILDDPRTVVTRGSTFENSQNLSSIFLEQVRKKYEGTRLGQQELYAEFLDDVPGALWTPKVIDDSRIRFVDGSCFSQVVIGVDPSVTSGENSDETGIIVAASDRNRKDFYVLDDLTIHASPAQWAKAVIAAYKKFNATKVVVEVNQGGDLLEHTLRSVEGGQRLVIEKVRARVGKRTRAEPVASLYEQGRVHHVGVLADLESQMCSWVPGDSSPDRMDALVWAVTQLTAPVDDFRSGSSMILGVGM